jgi:CRISPR/Cas system-associated exonuclease Cas4 (RecB family)
MTFGDTIHRTLFEFLNVAQERANHPQADLFGNATVRSDVLPFEDLKKMYETAWRDEWFESTREKEEYRERGLKMLHHFYHRYVTGTANVQLLEQPFKLKMGDMSIRGRIDRIDAVDGGIEIIDYKTGKPKDDSLSADDKKQLLLYAMAGRDVLHLHPVKLTFYYLENDTMVSFEPTEKEEVKLREKLIDEMTQIGSGDFTATPNPFICGTCPFRMMCEFKKM